MGLFGGIKKLGGNIKNAVVKGVKDVGHFAGDVATNPWVQGLTAAGLAATGVGAPAAAGIMAGMKGGGNLIKKGGNIKGALTGAGQGALLGGAAGLAGSGFKKLAGRTAFDLAKGFFKGGDGIVRDGDGNIVTGPDGEPVTDIPEGAEGGDIGIDDVGGEGGDLEAARNDEQNWLGEINDVITKVPGVKSIEGFIKDKAGNLIPGMGGGGGGPDWGKIAALGLGGAQIANQANLQNQSTQMGKDALAFANKNWESRAPLRDTGMAGMLAPKTADLSGMLANSGPYAAGLVPNMPVRKPVAGVGSFA